MPVSLIIALEPRWQSKLPRTTGHLTHGAVFSVLADRNPLLAERLHGPGHPRPPFSISPLIGPGTGRDGRQEMHEDRYYRLRIASLDGELSQELLRLERNPPPEITLSHLPLRVLGATTSPERDPWAARITWDELVGVGVRQRAEHTLTFTFASPTSFRQGDHNLPLPVPHLVFGSLAEVWSTCAPEPIRTLADALTPQGLDWAERTRALDRHIRLAGHQIKTRMLEFPEFKRVGFIGEVTFDLAHELDPTAVATAHTLAHLAQFSGVGDKTPMGMGQARVHRRPTPETDPWI